MMNKSVFFTDSLKNIIAIVKLGRRIYRCNRLETELFAALYSCKFRKESKVKRTVLYINFVLGYMQCIYKEFAD